MDASEEKRRTILKWVIGIGSCFIWVPVGNAILGDGGTAAEWGMVLWTIVVVVVDVLIYKAFVK